MKKINIIKKQDTDTIINMDSEEEFKQFLRNCGSQKMVLGYHKKTLGAPVFAITLDYNGDYSCYWLPKIHVGHHLEGHFSDYNYIVIDTKDFK